MTFNNNLKKFDYTESTKNSLANLFRTPIMAALMDFSSNESKRYNRTVKENIEWVIDAILDIVGTTSAEIMNSRSMHYVNNTMAYLCNHFGDLDLLRDLLIDELTDDQLAFASDRAFLQIVFAYSEGSYGFDCVCVIGKPTPSNAKGARKLIDSITDMLANAALR